MVEKGCNITKMLFISLLFQNTEKAESTLRGTLLDDSSPSVTKHPFKNLSKVN